ncbi:MULTISPECIES: hypothetical protein [Streptomycetaceae]|uniref:hypothetical protein n=1 Tax=Streptomycetaceae TaxID=2062 RepID=UPI000939646D|nr:hypothetical protein [Streptomyces sp. CB02056]OKI10367.1 hypothetical protein AMK13_04150 [Streptomyces sp. CB02056]
MPDPVLDPAADPDVLNALAASHYAVAPPVPDDFDWPKLETFVHDLGFAADDSDTALNLYRLLFAVQRVAYREAAGRNSPWQATRLHPRVAHGGPGPQ